MMGGAPTLLRVKDGDGNGMGMGWDGMDGMGGRGRERRKFGGRRLRGRRGVRGFVT